MPAPNHSLRSDSGRAPQHTPVLLEEVLKLTQPQSGDTVIDCTLGSGGYAKRFLEATEPTGRLLGLDRDAVAIQLAKTKLGEYQARMILKHGRFGALKSLIGDFPRPDIIVADLGLSSFALDDEQRGFAFQKFGPLDMRMDQTSGKTAAELLNTLELRELERILKNFGEERQAGKIARAIVERRKTKSFSTTQDLVQIVEAVYREVLKAQPGQKIWLKRQIHPATQTFQAFRIAVNDEISELEKFLPQAFEILKPGGRLAIVSFHSLEDRLVKNFFRNQAKICSCPAEQLQCTCDRIPAGKLLNKKPIQPNSAEIQINPRARSAKLRIIQKN
ncbi:16S rRNA (cytosine(1402)-N(4))-methyltransferase RsmH [Candidatus Parcubacteria bacterium]|jgi:16S rRNA (cytosine1402-N4)-methyltransferase|nr:MAG: 16S rRNA (cytosine(1402)-N(4))-methyltransferase RsmH [Candidatus Parcubacteria bacterium]